jgi:hypothetical protein
LAANLTRINAGGFGSSLTSTFRKTNLWDFGMSDSSFSGREVVGVFQEVDGLEAAMDELLASGFGRVDLSLLAGEDAVREKLGHAYRRTEDAEDDPNAPRAVYVSSESRGDAEGGLIGGLFYVGAVAAAGAVVASGGAVATAIAAAAAAGAGGGAIGSLLAGFLERHHADYIQSQLDHGGLVLWVNVRDAEHEKRSVEILSRHSAEDVHVHEI